MRRKQPFLYIFLFLSMSIQCLAQKTAKMYMDENGKIGVEIIPTQTLQVATPPQVNVTARLDDTFPENQVHLQLTFPESVNILSIKRIVLSIKTDEASRYLKYIIYSQKAVDPVNRVMNATIGGLKPNQLFNTQVFLFIDDAQYNCLGDLVGQVSFTTAKESTNRAKKLLLVIDKDLEGDLAIDSSLNNYISDITRYYNIIFEKVYIENQNSQKNNLLNKIKIDYNDAITPLRYVFFIGSNASTTIERQILDPNNNTPISTYFDLSINFYTQIHAPEYYFDVGGNRFVQKFYNHCSFSGMPINDIGNTIVQSNSFDLASGSIMPNGSTSKKNYIINYFSKLHQFKKGAISFNKSVLFADSQLYDGNSPSTLASINPRWQINDTINTPQKYGLTYHGYDPLWNQDYLAKLANQSYEVCMYMGHGSPNFHYYGISNSSISNLPSLNTMAFDFNSCSVGMFNQYDYLAGAYLEQGNTLFVKAYTTPVFLTTYDNKSPLIEYFRNGELFSDISKRMFFGDAYLYNSSNLTVQINLGDPLLQIDPPCAINSMTLESPFYDITGNTILASKIVITARNKIAEETNVTYQAGKSIILENGFEVKHGAMFKAMIGGCPQ